MASYKVSGLVKTRGRVYLTKSVAKGNNFFIISSQYAENSQKLGTFLYTVDWRFQAHETISLGVYSYPVSREDRMIFYYHPPSTMSGEPIVGFTLSAQSTIDDLVTGFAGPGYTFGFYRADFFNNNLTQVGASPGYPGFVSNDPNIGYGVYNTMTGEIMEEFLYAPQSPRTDYKSTPGQPDVNQPPYTPQNIRYTPVGGGIRG